MYTPTPRSRRRDVGQGLLVLAVERGYKQGSFKGDIDVDVEVEVGVDRAPLKGI